MVEAKLLRKKLKNGLIVDKWDLVTIIEKQQAEIANLKAGLLSHHDIYPVKELTDEEILISAQYNGIRASEILDEYVIDFARAILRKAQEK